MTTQNLPDLPDLAADALPFFELRCPWRVHAEAANYQEAFDVGQQYGTALIVFLAQHPDAPPNLLMSIMLTQAEALPQSPLAVERGYVAGFWGRIQGYLRNVC
jgi:hypothetical protein